MTTLDDDALHAAAGDYVAGDLVGDEASRFQAKLASDPSLPREVAFWQALHPAWNDGLTTDGLSESFADSVLARAGRESADRHRVIQLPVWAMIVTSAAAAALAIVALIPAIPANHTLSAPPTQAQMYAEDGAALVATAPTGPWERYLPRALVSHVESDNATAEVPHSRAWAGFWTRPVRITQDGHAGGGGHLVLRVAGGSPADGIGLRPGDIIVGIKDCPVSTPACIAHQLRTASPGEPIRIQWWRPGTGEQFATELVLETLYE